MRRIIVIAIITATCSLAFVAGAFGQTRDALIQIEKKIKELQSENARLRIKSDSIESSLEKNLKETETQIENLRLEGERLGEELKKQEISLAAQMAKNKSLSENSDKTLSNDLTRNTRFWVGAFIAAVFLSIFLFIFIRRAGQKATRKLRLELEETRTTLNEGSIKADSKILGLLERQMEISKSASNADPVSGEIDHTLALRVADEITRIENNLNQMDPDIRGHKQLSACLDRLKDNFLANDYELVSLLNLTYDPTMALIPDFVPDDGLESGQQIITKVTKPHVNFRGKMIQPGNVVVSVGD